VVLDLLPIVIGFEVVSGNHFALRQGLLHEQAALSGGEQLGYHGPRFRETFIEVTRHVMNFLGAANAFLGQSEEQLRKLWGKNSPVVSEWNRKRQDLHAARFSYRFVYVLRNFAQHSALPITDMGFRARGQAYDSLTFGIHIPLARDKLLSANFDWGRVRADIAAQPEKIELLPLLDEHVESLREILCNALRNFHARMAGAGRCIEELVHELRAPDGAALVVFLGEDVRPGIAPRKQMHVPVNEYRFIAQHLGDCTRAPG
jgi:hypothetical protein